ncbi:MAG: AAA family ATPase [Candidatus Thorarchaeota archaeon]
MEKFNQEIQRKVIEVQEEVYIKEEKLRKIIAIFLSIKNNKYPGGNPPRGLLFYGPPGTGKTLLMKTLASKLNFSEPIIIRGPEIFSQYYGKSEAKLRQIFALAEEDANEHGLSIIFIDELDSIAPSRDSTKGDLEPRLVGQLLTLMDGFKSQEKKPENGHVIIIGSTNRPDILDPALRRPGRFDLEIEFDPPDSKERAEILKIILKQFPKGQYDNSIKFKHISEKLIGFTGADILQLINESFLKSLLDGKNFISEDDLLSSIKFVKPSALREFYIEPPKDRITSIKDELLKNEIKELSNRFSTNPKFTSILIKDFSLADSIASTIAFQVLKKSKFKCPYIEVRGIMYTSRHFGEMEKSIRKLFQKINFLEISIVYVKSIDSIAGSSQENLRGAVIELLEDLYNLKNSNHKVLFMCSASGEIDKNIKDILDEF